MPISRILWGAAFANTLRLGYPLFDVLTDHEERPGSEHDVDGAGVPVVWIEGRDYVMEAEVRWIPDHTGTTPVQTALSGTAGWQEFLDWARDGKALRFIPDENSLGTYIDNVYLVEPMVGFGNLSSDIKRNVRIKLRNATQDFHTALRGAAP